MTPLHLPPAALTRMQRHGEESYPEECCGFLIAREASVAGSPVRAIDRVERAANRVEAERSRRFVIRPDELVRLEDQLTGSHERVVGFYHSHPDHPARPSNFDQEYAWPWYIYLVLSVAKGKAEDVGAFELDPTTREFARVPLALTESDGLQELPSR
ncbi:MAG: M67 family metallopeptidase [Thermoplasmata archaeon]|jgi:proteasome lid subunit RPN8/RPN11